MIPFRPNDYCKALAAAAKTARIASVIKLFKAGFVPDPDTVVADLDANECDYDDYAPATIAAWLPEVVSVAGGWQITAPTTQFDCTALQVVQNMVGGFWIELAAGTVFLIRVFDNPAPMADTGNFIQVTPTEVFGNGA